MRKTLLAVAMFAAASALPAQDFMGDMHRDLNQVQRKVIELAKAMPDASFDWRPGPGVRSVREVFLHISAENYFLPFLMGSPIPAASGINGTDYKTVEAYEAKPLTKAQVVAELEASFRHIHSAIGVNTATNLGENVKFFGTDMTRMRAMTSTVTHVHEHLGQLIAYARTNNVKPPWSQ